MGNSLQIRNIAIIAHVDHGKTTLVSQLLQQARALRHGATGFLDTGIEAERGITILAKNTAVRWGETKINIVDTPGHADFGGEVERILRMVDGFLLLVDAAEGPMPQTKFVAGKALALGLKPIVLVNKIDRQDAEPLRVHDEVLELFLELEATPEQFNCPFLYTSSRAGTATFDLKTPGPDLKPLFETILGTIPPPQADAAGPLQMLVSALDYSSYLGRIAIGRIDRGRMRVGDTVAVLPLGPPGPLGDGAYEQARVVKLFGFEGLERVELEEAVAGEIVALAGLAGVEIGKTITAPDHLERLAGIAVEEPTISVDCKVNDSPFAGREGKLVTGRQLRERLFRELERNVALRGTGMMHHRFFEYGPWAGPISGRSRGVMVADRQGVAVAYALFNLQERGTMFVKPGEPVYEGMVVGENSRTDDMDVNPSKEKKLTNMRTTASDEMIILEPPRQITLELALEYIEDDELIEVTPSSIRLRKRALGATERRKLARNARAEEA